MKNNTNEKTLSELSELPSNEPEKRYIVSNLESIFLGEDDFCSAFEFFLNIRISKIKP